MNRFRLAVVALALVVIPGITSTESLSNSLHADEAAQSVKADALVKRTYRTADLPIWNNDGKSFNHAVLTALLKARVGEAAWGQESEVAPYMQSVSLVITTTEPNHDIIAKTLEELRQEAIPVAESPEQLTEIQQRSVWAKNYQAALDAIEVLSAEREQQEKQLDTLAASREPGSPPSLGERRIEARIRRTTMSIGRAIARIKTLAEMHGEQVLREF